MPKKYQLLIDSPTQPKGMIATQEPGGTYQAHNPSAPADENFYFPAYIVENRPTVWQEIEEVPEKKIVERWRAGRGHYYEGLHGAMKEDNHTVDDRNFQEGRYFKSESVSDRARQRTEIMCRLMGLAETIEEGSTEMKSKYTLYCDDRKIKVWWSGLWQQHSDLATFSTKELAKLFLDSAGQDAIDWYGAVK